MEFTRRQALAALAARPFSVTAPSGLRLEMHGNPERPSVAVFLPGAKAPAAIIEMPEHAWRKENPADEPLWFYKMYSSDPKLQGEVIWTADAHSLSYTMKTPSGFTLQ